MKGNVKKVMGHRLTQLRKERYLTHSDIAEVFDPPVCIATVSHWEHARNVPSSYRLLQLADFYDVSIDYLYGRTEKRKVNLERECQSS